MLSADLLAMVVDFTLGAGAAVFLLLPRFARAIRWRSREVAAPTDATDGDA